MEKTWTFDNLHILLLKEEDLWVAQCLDHDVAAQGASPWAALKAWQHAFFAQAMANIEIGQEPMVNADRAPEFYWTQFESGLRISETLAAAGAAADELAPPPVQVKDVELRLASAA